MMTARIAAGCFALGTIATGIYGWTMSIVFLAMGALIWLMRPRARKTPSS